MAEGSGRRAADRALPLRRGLLQIIAVLVVVLLVAAAVLAGTVRELQATQDRVQQQLLPATLDAQRLLDLFINEETGQRGLVITGDPSFLEPYRQASADLPAAVTDLRRHTADVPTASAVLEQVLDAHRAWLSRAALPELAAARSGDLERARQLVSTGDGRRLFAELRARNQALQQTISVALLSADTRVQVLSSRLGWLLALTLSLLALGVGLLYPALLRLVVGPMRRFEAAARRAGHDLSDPVVVDGPREVVTAGRAVEGMRLRLVREVRAARQASEALLQRGPAVLALRDALAARPVAVPGLELASRLDAAEGVLAGDWFDAVALDGGRLALVLGDVAGHGPGPAVFALRLKHLIGAALVVGKTPGEALSVTARHLGDTGEAFATVFVAVLDPAAGHLTYANAGHPSALLLPAARRPASSMPAPAPVELEPTGPLLSSLDPTWSWDTTSCRFDPGDVLVAYTDGLVEARDGAGEQYGQDGLRAGLVERAGNGSMAELIEHLLSGAHRHAGGRTDDDSTVVACRRV